MKTVNPKKKFGQNFLNDKSIAVQIVNFLSTEKTNNIIEVGPGMGILTKELLKIDNLNKKFIELDKECCDYLLNNFSEIKKDLINDDFLKFDIKKLNPPVSIIGNFPYNISSQIVFKMLENRTQIPEFSGMFQKEVAERICENEGNKTYGILSVLVQAFYTAEYLFTVPPSVFNPPPKVDSGVLRLTRKEDYVLPCNEKLFFSVVKSAFQQRRKTLRNSLKGFNLSENLKANTIFGQRPEQLSVEAFVKLASTIGSKH